MRAPGGPRAWYSSRFELFLEDRFVDIVEEQFDLAVRIGTPVPQDLVARELAVWPRYIVASPEYVKRKGRPRRITDLARHDFLRYPIWNAPSSAARARTSSFLRLSSRLTIQQGWKAMPAPARTASSSETALLIRYAWAMRASPPLAGL